MSTIVEVGSEEEEENIQCQLHQRKGRGDRRRGATTA